MNTGQNPSRGARPALLPFGPGSTLGRSIFLLAFVPAIAVAQQRPTLESIMGAPFPDQMTAAPTGAHVAWVQNDRGVRNIWVAASPDYVGRALTTYADDDGQEIGGLSWAPDRSTLVFVRGGAPNRAGDNPNPTSDPAGAEQALWRVALDGGAPVRIGPGSSPAVSPKGDVVAFLRGGQVWASPLDGSAEPARLLQVRGGAGSLRWSPDGERLAFVSARGDHAFVGVLDVASKRITWLDPGVDRDANPVWSPDGSRVAFTRIPASTGLTLFRAVRTAQPWSIRVADAATGRSTEVWRARPGRGSAFRGVVAENQLFWSADGFLVFPWEADGWTHLYSVAVAGGEARLLTPGSFEVEHVAPTPDARALVFSSNQDDIDRRHLWRVAAAGGPPVAVTAGNGIEWGPAVTGDGAVAFLRSGARQPARASILPAAGGSAIGARDRADAAAATWQARVRDLAPGTVPAGFPADALVEPQPVVLSAADGMRIHGQLFTPADLRAGERRPAVLFFHGGSRRQMLLGWHYLGYYNHAYALNQYLASRGFIVLSVNFRSGTGYGLEFREAIDYGAGGASEFNDVLGAGLYLRSRSDVDPDRIGLWGGSYGGYLTALGLARASDLFKAGVDFHGVHDWNVGIRTFVPTYDRLEDPAAAAVAFQSSPMAHLDTWRSPVLVIHGDDDRNVSFSETVALVEALRDRGVEVEPLVFPDEVHGFLLHRRWLEAYTASAAFLQRHLGVR